MAEDEQWMSKALELAQYAATQEEVPVGAVLIYKNEIIGSGWNQPISQNDPSAHAEVIALRAAANSINNYRLIDTTMFVTLEPCVMCVGAMLHARIKRLVFGTSDPKTGAAGSVFNVISDSRHNHAIEVTAGVLQEECVEILQHFFKQRR